MASEIIYYVTEFATQTVFLLAALWIMIKVQKLDYKFLPLLGAAALSSGLDMIPFAGHYISLVVLLLCLKKITEAEMVPDVVFTVAVGYALMFGMNLWLLGALLGDLRPSALESADKDAPPEVAAELQDAEPTNRPVAAAAGTNVKTTAVEVVAAPPAQPSAKPEGNSEVKSAQEFAKLLSLKGVINGPRPMATLQCGSKSYTIRVGESALVDSGRERIQVRCESTSSDSAVFSFSGTQIRLSLR
ncbi:MAG: hypothetical protein EPO07_03470 [Verrucomicrobia bacterium]|nr:MAG: hypothetical protein EPO07_03470 [Verrucomicrobiota bacterium]